jgi:ubiquinol-cytochrome c reductase cytochrome c1 subunit
MRRVIIACSTAVAFVLAGCSPDAQDAQNVEAEKQAQCLAEIAAQHPEEHGEWDFNSIFGTYDQAALQRGFQVYKDVCAACHSMNLLAYRHLSGIGLGEDDIKAVAASVQVTDGPNDEGEMFERPGLPSDKFHPPFPNDQAARAANNGSLPPDLSLMAKAREGGPDHLVAVMTGYGEPPACLKMNEGMSFNHAFAAGGFQIAMPAPLSDGVVTYADGTQATVPQMAHDVAYFLSWASEPNLNDRHLIGVGTILFLIVLTAFFYAVYRKVWSDVH